jgi:hypothetical protein
VRLLGIPWILTENPITFKHFFEMAQLSAYRSMDPFSDKRSLMHGHDNRIIARLENEQPDEETENRDEDTHHPVYLSTNHPCLHRCRVM